MGSEYSSRTAAHTLEWIEAIVGFLKPYTFLSNAHVVNFFKDKLWEALDKDWISCLSREPIQNLLLIPSGIVQAHWPASLKEFVSTVRSLSLPQRQANLEKILPNVHITSLGPVLAQGMNVKKKHEVEVLSAIVDSIARSVKAQTIVDVGAGQGYLSQVLAFQYDLSVIAIDASSHHAKVAEARAERIRKHYAAQIHKQQYQNKNLMVPTTVICHIMSADMLKTLSRSVLLFDKQPALFGHPANLEQTKLHQCDLKSEASLVLTGLHACGDLSVKMLKSFSECEDIKAVVSLGCCYNLLSEEDSATSDSEYGFPMSNAVRCAGVCLGKSSRDLACQSADRWRILGDESGIHNFELHAFRAAFQMVLDKHYPEISSAHPSIGRQGKSLRRQKLRGSLKSWLDPENIVSVSLDGKQFGTKAEVTRESSETNADFVIVDYADLVLDPCQI
uniref:Methyltransferase domain-containing protein n=1 Tax=Kalanchoe fedtschenkoi TaxID=63787 RepID=A0A7N1A434_KALFE